MEIAIWIIGINWGAPLLFWIYPLIMVMVFKDFVFEGFYGPFAKFRLLNRGETVDGDPIEPWHALLWMDWWGVCLHWFICYRDRLGGWDDKQVQRGLIHESTHGYQQLVLGLLFWVAYIGHMLIIFAIQLIKHGFGPYARNAYLDCWAERMARKRAGQQVDIPPKHWMHGPKDLWPWW